jgi:mRNA interferase MazF
MPNQPLTNKAERGAVVLVPFPNSDLQTAKLRPALIVQANNLNTNLPQVVLVMISSNLNRAGHKSRVLIETKTEFGSKSGLLFDSVVMTDNFATILTANIARIIGKLEEMSPVDEALKHTLGL